MTNNSGSTESTAALSLRGTVAEWLGDKLILQQFTHENCPPERDITTCPRDSDGKHRPCMECWLEFVLEQTDSLLALLSQYGVVRLDENQELPTNPFREGLKIHRTVWGECQDEMVQDNFKRVRPLVEEKRNEVFDL